MKKLILIGLIGIVVAALALQLWRTHDDRLLDDVWTSLVANVDDNAGRFDPALVDSLPEPARRFFLATIKPGTPIRTVAEITMHGELSLGNKQNPSSSPMQACQLLAPPFGFYWQVQAGEGLMRFKGSDGSTADHSWTRFWLAGLIPVARLGDSADHALSSFGRYMGEALFWTPAALLPSASVVWSALGADSARVTVSFNGLTQAFDLTVDAAGRPVKVRFERWSDANASKTYQRQPFGGYLSDFKDFEGYWLPTTVVAGNHFETDDYFAFFKAKVDNVRFIDGAAAKPQCTLN